MFVSVRSNRVRVTQRDDDATLAQFTRVPKRYRFQLDGINAEHCQIVPRVGTNNRRFEGPLLSPNIVVRIVNIAQCMPACEDQTRWVNHDAGGEFVRSAN